MVVPWIGFELRALLDRVGVQPSAKYVAFETLLRPEEMPGTRIPVLDWPYREGLRLDEAMHPLTIMATGIYGRDIPNQNGAPLRLVVPWKYGFKSIKSIVRITLVEEQPPASWNMSQPSEYGFYSNVNPEVDHPRWSQATERRIGGGLFARQAADADVQRLRRGGRGPLCRDGPDRKFLMGVTESRLTLPCCGAMVDAQMPVDACQFFYECPVCKMVVRAAQSDCCVFCSYGTVPCLPVQASACCGADPTR